jgi:hypothetical protein
MHLVICIYGVSVCVERQRQPTLLEWLWGGGYGVVDLRRCSHRLLKGAVRLEYIGHEPVAKVRASLTRGHSVRHQTTKG